MCTKKIVKNTLFALLFLSLPFFATFVHKNGTEQAARQECAQYPTAQRKDLTPSHWVR